MRRWCAPALVLALLSACADDAPPRAAAAPSSSSSATSTTTTTTTTSTTATTVVTTTTAAAVPAQGKVVVIDPGHNEHNAAHPREINQPVDVVTEKKACDTTGTATDDGYSEAAFTTDLAARVAERLRNRGVTVVLTRDASTPWGPCITERAAIGNDAHADVAISLHADGGPADGRGFHVIEPGLVAGHNDGIIEPSHAFALLLRDTFRSEGAMPVSNYLGTNGIDRRTDLGGLNLSTVPKVFLECGNMRNATDAALLEDGSWRDGAAAAIADAITAYLAG
jgi:N-acetylmuramoyl-L-alanine amidase